MKYTGSCHCKKVIYEADLDLSQPAIECNCSHCSSKGLLLQFIPEASFVLREGQEFLTEYRFNTHKITHEFCSVCGVQPFAKGSDKEGNPVATINLRTIDGFDTAEITRMPFDGKSW